MHVEFVTYSFLSWSRTRGTRLY